MKVKGVKRGNTIELIDQAIDIPDGTEITLIIEEPTGATLEAYLAQIEVSADDMPLTSLIGSASGSFNSPEEADLFIRKERDAWDY